MPGENARRGPAAQRMMKSRTSQANSTTLPPADCIIHGMLPDLALGDVVRMRKAHPCGSSEWNVVRLGADIGLTCRGCGHRILLSRRDLAKRMKHGANRGLHGPTAV